ncbi:MAG: isoprenylcysteine carboxylmethyltransferase family protein [Vicinamibacterales bacterium]
MPRSDRPRAGLAMAWLGGVAFATSLAVYVHFFAVRLATPGPPTWPRPVALAWNAALFVLFAAHHSAMARPAAKAWVGRHLPAAFERTTYVWVAATLLVLVTVLWRRVPGVVYVVPGAGAVALHLLQSAGVVLTLAAARVLSATDLAGIRQAQRRPAVADVRVVWPYTLVRHPIYLGWALTVLAAPTMTLDRLWWALLSTGYLVIATPWEERSLSAVAGPAYRAYCRRVRWRMVPGLY